MVFHALMPTNWHLVADRRGSTVWEVRSPRGHYAVKLGHPIEATPDWPALSPAREGAVLHNLGREDVAYGEREHGTWNVQPWHAGPDLYALWEPRRRHTLARDPHISVTPGCIDALAELHAKGWAHGDVQPTHFITSPDQVHLIDLAHGGDIPAQYDFPYRGCLVHYEAPEVCGRLRTAVQAHLQRFLNAEKYFVDRFNS